MVLALISSIINNFLPNSITIVIRLLIPIFSLFAGGFYLGRHSIEKGYLEGIKLSVIYVIIIFILSLFFSSFKLINILNYAILIIASSLGGMLGINKRKIED